MRPFSRHRGLLSVAMWLGFFQLAACSMSPAPADPAAIAAQGQEVWIPVVNGSGEHYSLFARVCRPSGSGPWRVTVINHGTITGSRESRMREKPLSCTSKLVEWFTRRDLLVVLPMRRGYGATGGDFAEDEGSQQFPDFARAGAETALDIDVATRWALQRPDARHDGATVIGVSGSGWGVLVYSSFAHPGVDALINIAGGRGLRSLVDVVDLTDPDQLYRLAARYGATSRTPMLWLYTENDSKFGPEYARALHRAFASTGGQANLIISPPFSYEGHHLFTSAGVAIWGPIIQTYLRSRLPGWQGVESMSATSLPIVMGSK